MARDVPWPLAVAPGFKPPVGQILCTVKERTDFQTPEEQVDATTPRHATALILSCGCMVAKGGDQPAPAEPREGDLVVHACDPSFHTLQL